MSEYTNPTPNIKQWTTDDCGCCCDCGRPHGIPPSLTEEIWIANDATSHLALLDNIELLPIGLNNTNGEWVQLRQWDLVTPRDPEDPCEYELVWKNTGLVLEDTFPRNPDGSIMPFSNPAPGEANPWGYSPPWQIRTEWDDATLTMIADGSRPGAIGDRFSFSYLNANYPAAMVYPYLPDGTVGTAQGYGAIVPVAKVTTRYALLEVGPGFNVLAIDNYGQTATGTFQEQGPPSQSRSWMGFIRTRIGDRLGAGTELRCSRCNLPDSEVQLVATVQPIRQGTQLPSALVPQVLRMVPTNGFPFSGVTGSIAESYGALGQVGDIPFKSDVWRKIVGMPPTRYITTETLSGPERVNGFQITCEQEPGQEGLIPYPVPGGFNVILVKKNSYPQYGKTTQDYQNDLGVVYRSYTDPWEADFVSQSFMRVGPNSFQFLQNTDNRPLIVRQNRTVELTTFGSTTAKQLYGVHVIEDGASEEPMWPAGMTFPLRWSTLPVNPARYGTSALYTGSGSFFGYGNYDYYLAIYAISDFLWEQYPYNGGDAPDDDGATSVPGVMWSRYQYDVRSWVLPSHFNNNTELAKVRWGSVSVSPIERVTITNVDTDATTVVEWRSSLVLDNGYERQWVWKLQAVSSDYEIVNGGVNVPGGQYEFEIELHAGLPGFEHLGGTVRTQWYSTGGGGLALGGTSLPAFGFGYDITTPYIPFVFTPDGGSPAQQAYRYICSWLFSPHGAMTAHMVSAVLEPQAAFIVNATASRARMAVHGFDPAFLSDPLPPPVTPEVIPLYTISGQVTSPDGTVVEGRTIQAGPAGNSALVGSGVYTIANLPAGAYRVEVAGLIPGELSTPVFYDVVVGKGIPPRTDVNFVLTTSFPPGTTEALVAVVTVDSSRVSGVVVTFTDDTTATVIDTKTTDSFGVTPFVLATSGHTIRVSFTYSSGVYFTWIDSLGAVSGTGTIASRVMPDESIEIQFTGITGSPPPPPPPPGPPRDPDVRVEELDRESGMFRVTVTPVGMGATDYDTTISGPPPTIRITQLDAETGEYEIEIIPPVGVTATDYDTTIEGPD